MTVLYFWKKNMFWKKEELHLSSLKKKQTRAYIMSWLNIIHYSTLKILLKLPLRLNTLFATVTQVHPYLTTYKLMSCRIKQVQVSADLMLQQMFSLALLSPYNPQIYPKSHTLNKGWFHICACIYKCHSIHMIKYLAMFQIGKHLGGAGLMHFLKFSPFKMNSTLH